MPPTCMKTKTKRLLRTGDERAVTQSVPRFAPVRSLLELLTRSAPAGDGLAEQQAQCSHRAGSPRPVRKARRRQTAPR